MIINIYTLTYFETFKNNEGALPLVSCKGLLRHSQWEKICSQDNMHNMISFTKRKTFLWKHSLCHIENADTHL